jgi:nicotinamide-nucleotide amidase
MIADRIGAIEGGVGDVGLAYLPNVAGVDLRLTVRDVAPEAADALLAKAAERVRGAMGDAIYGEDDADLAAVVLESCRARRLTLAVAESCTGGMLGARLTAIPGSSDVVLGGVIAYDDAVKREQLGVSAAVIEANGAVSEQVVRAMASGVRELLKAGAAMAITGVAGPGGGTPEKPVGTVWIAVDVGGVVESRLLRLWGDRDEVRQRSAQAVLELLRRTLASA